MPEAIQETPSNQRTPQPLLGFLTYVWIAVFALVATVFGATGVSVVSTTAFRWFAVAVVLVAFAGRTRRWPAVASALLAGFGALYVVAERTHQVLATGQPAAWPYVVGGLLVAGLSAYQLRGGARRFDPVALIALQLGVGLLARWLYFVLSGLGLEPALYAPGTWTSPLITELPLLALGLAGVGLGVTRGVGGSVRRLGIAWPSWWRIGVAMLISQLLVLSSYPATLLTYQLMPHTYFAIEQILAKSDGDSNFLLGAVIAVLAGVAEETLFRGALQPRAGILITAALFASIHIQYGASPILAMVFVHGLIYGLLRRHINTTTAILTHALYDLPVHLPLAGHLLWILFMVLLLLYPALKSWREILRSVRAVTAEDLAGLKRRCVSVLPR